MICVKIVAHILGFGCCLEVFALMLISKNKLATCRSLKYVSSSRVWIPDVDSLSLSFSAYTMDQRFVGYILANLLDPRYQLQCIINDSFKKPNNKQTRVLIK